MTQIRILTALVLLAACSQEAAPAEPVPVPEPTPAPVAEVEPPPVVPTPEPDPTPDELPIEQDFEEEVAVQITATNFRGELKKLEAEIASDSAP